MTKNASRATGWKIVLCTLLLPFGSGAGFADPLPQPAQAAFDQKVVARASAERALEHIAYLSEVIGSRPAGLDAEWQGAAYIASVLEDLGYEVELQSFPVDDQYVGRVELASGATLEMYASRDGLITGDEFISGEMIEVFGGSYPRDFPPETPGKIVLMRRLTSFARQVRNAVSSGAIGVILFDPIIRPGEYGGAWKPSFAPPVGIPVLGASWNQGVWLQEILAQGSVTLKVQTKRHENLESVNVIGTRRARNGNLAANAVLVTAHLDSVVGSPGADDNASGVGLALELARVLRNYNIDKELRFVLFGSEETPPFGADAYIDQLSDAELDRIVGVFNSDMVATSSPDSDQFYVMTVDGMSNLVSDAAEAAGSRLGNSNLLAGQFGSSDHENFHAVGVPAALFVWLGGDVGDPFGLRFEAVYHTFQDTLVENIDGERMQRALNIVGAAVFDLVRKDVPALERSRVRAAPIETDPLEYDSE